MFYNLICRIYNNCMKLYDKYFDKLFYNWLFFTFFLVFLMIIVGGLTRLTNSGLSITEWELFRGILPPVTDQSWNNYFSLYKDIPQYKFVNNTITLNEFKIIFYWEYFHRILGRIIGLFFLIPFIFFYVTKTIDKRFVPSCFLILLLIILQGFVGWYMVKSGLVNNVTVSHYRLSLHLGIAFVIISLLFWNIINIKRESFKSFFGFGKFNYLFYFLVFIIFFQIILGAFVSGLDAGKIYQTWPLMNYSYFPEDIVVNSIIDLINFESHSLIQFYHRNVAYFITIYILFLGIFIFKMNLKKLIMPFLILLTILFIQIFLGIITLLSDLNIYLASGHQICSLLLILCAINLHYYQIK